LEHGATYNTTTLELVNFETNFINLGTPIDLDDEVVTATLTSEPASEAFIYDREAGYLVFSVA
jgi:hypothetical protein